MDSSTENTVWDKTQRCKEKKRTENLRYISGVTFPLISRKPMLRSVAVHVETNSHDLMQHDALS